MSPKRLLGTTALLIACSLSGTAWAHAHLTGQTPAADTTVASPTQLRLSFSEGVEAAFSEVTLRAADGQVVAVRPLVTQDNDKKVLLVTPTTPLASGDYTVNWKVVSVDTHKSAGTYHFQVGQ